MMPSAAGMAGMYENGAFTRVIILCDGLHNYSKAAEADYHPK